MKNRKSKNYYLRAIAVNTGSRLDGEFKSNLYYLKEIAKNTKNGGD